MDNGCISNTIVSFHLVSDFTLNHGYGRKGTFFPLDFWDSTLPYHGIISQFPWTTGWEGGTCFFVCFTSPTYTPVLQYMSITFRKKGKYLVAKILVIEEILHHLGCIEPLSIRSNIYLYQLVSRISEPSTVWCNIGTWVFPKIVVPPKWMVYNGEPY